MIVSVVLNDQADRVWIPYRGVWWLESARSLVAERLQLDVEDVSGGRIAWLALVEERVPGEPVWSRWRGAEPVSHRVAFFEFDVLSGLVAPIVTRSVKSRCTAISGPWIPIKVLPCVLDATGRLRCYVERLGSTSD